MIKKYKKVYSISLEPGYRNYTVKDLLDIKGKKKLSQIHVSTPDEAMAAEEANIDLLLVRAFPGLKEIRKAAPKTFISVSIPFIKYSSKYEIVKDSLEIIDRKIRSQEAYNGAILIHKGKKYYTKSYNLDGKIKNNISKSLLIKFDDCLIQFIINIDPKYKPLPTYVISKWV